MPEQNEKSNKEIAIKNEQNRNSGAKELMKLKKIQ